MDLVTFGEAMVRLTPPGSERIEQARSFDVYVGGSELNVAVAAARLGIRAAWLSRLPHNALGRMIASRAREHGVDVSRVTWTDPGDDRAGLDVVELGAAPRPSSVLYDRTGSAMSRVTPGTIDWAAAFAGARWFHTSGITPALSESAAATVGEALVAAKKAGLRGRDRGRHWDRRRVRSRTHRRETAQRRLGDHGPRSDRVVGSATHGAEQLLEGENLRVSR